MRCHVSEAQDCRADTRKRVNKPRRGHKDHVHGDGRDATTELFTGKKMPSTKSVLTKTR